METKIYWHEKSVEELFTYLETGNGGLTDAEVKRRLEYFGHNVLPEAKPESIVAIFVRQFKSPLIYLLLAAAAIVSIMGEYVDGAIIALVLILNALAGSIQEGRAARSLQSLKLLGRTEATVRRSGRESIVHESELVPGDILILREGEKVPADCRIVEQSSLLVNESMLTGESVSVPKTAEAMPKRKARVPLPEQRNMLFCGTYITAGNAAAVVVSTGARSELGSISKSLTNIEKEIPLQRRINHLANILILVTLGVSLLLIGAGLARGLELRSIFSIAVSLAVSIIPEGLPVAVTLILTAGVWRMSKRNALVKKLHALEALGQLDVIAVDKTGTLTKNQMTAVAIISPSHTYHINGSGYETEGGVEVDGALVVASEYPELLTAGTVFAFCGNARVYTDERTGENKIAGDPTDAALVIAAKKLGFSREELILTHPIIEELPFDYNRKFHATVHKVGAHYFLSAIGALESIMPLCDYEHKRSVATQATRFAKKGLRVLAFAYSEKAKMVNLDALPKLTYGGLVLLEDPLQPEIADAVKQLKQAGLTTVMLTGDTAATARAIATKAGIYLPGQSETLDSDAIQRGLLPESADELRKTAVFARVTPQDKLALIRHYGKRGLVISMTGDGVNDAPALLAADVGMAMGRNGTEVAKEAADIVLLDDNFSTIVAAVEEGRNIFLNIQKVLLYLFSTSLGELLTISIAVLAGLPLPLIAVQIIWLNFVTDGFLTAALGFEPKQSGSLKRPFHKLSQYLLDTFSVGRMIVMGTSIAGVALYIFILSPGDLLYKQTLTLSVLAVTQWFNAWNSRTRSTIFTSKPWQNKWLIGATGAVVCLQLLAVYWSPLARTLGTTPLAAEDWITVICAGASIVVADELYKLLTSVLGRKLDK